MRNQGDQRLRLLVKWVLLGTVLGIVISVLLALAIRRIGSVGPPVAEAIAVGIGSFVGVVIAGLLVLRRH